MSLAFRHGHVMGLAQPGGFTNSISLSHGSGGSWKSEIEVVTELVPSQG